MVTVHLLATCRKPELMPAVLMVFDTIRIGFPTARIQVRVNPNHWGMDPLKKAAHRVGAVLYEPYRYTPHDEWIGNLVSLTSEPFWICDTDVRFNSKVENWTFNAPFAGRYIPEFMCPFVKRVTHDRLHTALMWFDPQKVLEGIHATNAITPSHPFKTEIHYFKPLYYSQRKGGVVRHCLHDTCGQLYHCIGGQAFTAEQNAAFEHLNCGTYSDLVEPLIPGIVDKHRAVFACPALLDGATAHQYEFYARHPVPPA